MEQDVMAGIGNIYRAELLFRARLSPFRPGCEVAGGDAAVDLEGSRAVDAGGHGGSADCDDAGRSDRPHTKDEATLKEEVHYVYRRRGEAVLGLRDRVMKEDMAGRKLYWCPVCQAE